MLRESISGDASLFSECVLGCCVCLVFIQSLFLSLSFFLCVVMLTG